MLLIATSTDDVLLGYFNINDLEWPWTPKILILYYFLIRRPITQPEFCLTKTTWVIFGIIGAHRAM